MDATGNNNGAKTMTANEIAKAIRIQNKATKLLDKVWTVDGANEPTAQYGRIMFEATTEAALVEVARRLGRTVRPVGHGVYVVDVAENAFAGGAVAR